MQTEMNTEMRELMRAELDAVNGGTTFPLPRPGPIPLPFPLPHIDPKVFEKV